MGLRTFTTMGELLCIIVLYFVGYPPVEYGFDFIGVVTLLITPWKESYDQLR